MKYILIPIFVVLIDQISKISIKNYWLENNLFYSNINIVGNFIRFTFIENPGIAFGINTSKFHIYITLITIIAICFIIYYLYSLIKINSYESLSWSFILGGAIGNCIDRIFVLIPNLEYDGVIDFIDIGVNQYRWYIFNFADTAITVGLIIYFYQTYISKKYRLFEKEN